MSKIYPSLTLSPTSFILLTPFNVASAIKSPLTSCDPSALFTVYSPTVSLPPKLSPVMVAPPFFSAEKSVFKSLSPNFPLTVYLPLAPVAQATGKITRAAKPLSLKSSFTVFSPLLKPITSASPPVKFIFAPSAIRQFAVAFISSALPTFFIIVLPLQSAAHIRYLCAVDLLGGAKIVPFAINGEISATIRIFPRLF